MSEIFDRFTQVYELREENLRLSRLIQNNEKIKVLDQSLHVEYDYLSEIREHWPDLVANLDYLNDKLEKATN